MSAKSEPQLTLSQHTKNAKKRAKAPPVQRQPMPPIQCIPKEKIVQVITRSVVPGEAERTYAYCMLKTGDNETRAATIGEMVDVGKESEHLEVISYISLKTLVVQYSIEKILERCNRRGHWSDCSSAFIPDNELWNRVCDLQHVPEWVEPVRDFRAFMVAMERQWCAKHPLANYELDPTRLGLVEKTYATPTPYYEPAPADRGKPAVKETSDEDAKKPTVPKEQTAKEEPAKPESKKEEKITPEKEKKKTKKHSKKENKAEDSMVQLQQELEEKEKEDEADNDQEEPEPPRKKKRSQPTEERQESPPKRTKAQPEEAKPKPKPALKKEQPTASLQPKIQLPKEGFESTFTTTHVYHFVTTQLVKKSQKRKAKVAVLNPSEIVEHIRVYSSDPQRQKCLVLFLAMLEAIALGDSTMPFMHIPIPGQNTLSKEISTHTTVDFKIQVDLLLQEVAELAKRTKQRKIEEDALLDKFVQVTKEHSIVTCLRNIHQHAQLKYFWLMYTTAAALGFPSEEQITTFAKSIELLPELRGLYRSLEPKAK